MSIVSRIRDLCSNHGTTLAALERQLGLSKASIAKWDTSSPSINKVKLVAKHFNVTTDYLILGIDENTIGGRIKKIRYSRKLMRRELANALGVGVTTISSIENDFRTPDSDMLNKIASYFKVDVAYFTQSKGIEDVNISFLESKGYSNKVEKNLTEAYSLLKEHSDKLDNKQREDLTQLIKWYLDKELNIL